MRRVSISKWIDTGGGGGGGIELGWGFSLWSLIAHSVRFVEYCPLADEGAATAGTSKLTIEADIIASLKADNVVQDSWLVQYPPQGCCEIVFRGTNPAGTTESQPQESNYSYHCGVVD